MVRMHTLPTILCTGLRFLGAAVVKIIIHTVRYYAFAHFVADVGVT